VAREGRNTTKQKLKLSISVPPVMDQESSRTRHKGSIDMSRRSSSAIICALTPKNTTERGESTLVIETSLKIPDRPIAVGPMNEKSAGRQGSQTLSGPPFDCWEKLNLE